MSASAPSASDLQQGRLPALNDGGGTDRRPRAADPFGGPRRGRDTGSRPEPPNPCRRLRRDPQGRVVERPHPRPRRHRECCANRRRSAGWARTPCTQGRAPSRTVEHDVAESRRVHDHAAIGSGTHPNRRCSRSARRTGSRTRRRPGPADRACADADHLCERTSPARCFVHPRVERTSREGHGARAPSTPASPGSAGAGHGWPDIAEPAPPATCAHVSAPRGRSGRPAHARATRQQPREAAGIAARNPRRHPPVAQEPHRHARDRERPRIVVERRQAVIANRIPDVAARIAAGGIGHVRDERVRQVDDAPCRSPAAAGSSPSLRRRRRTTRDIRRARGTPTAGADAQSR